MSIADTLTEGFYILEIDGAAVDLILPGDFGIERIVIGSSKFKSDMHAASALQTSIGKIADNFDEVNVEVEFNPDFFPSLQSIKLSAEKQQALDNLAEYEDHMTEQLDEENKLAVAMPSLFDPLGDYVETRWVCKSANFNMLGRVAVDPDVYIQQRIATKLQMANNLIDTKPTQLH